MILEYEINWKVAKVCIFNTLVYSLLHSEENWLYFFLV
jgi:hypothetical protein